MSDAPTALNLDRSPARVFSWAAYLACSWTWCIGMFLPVLLWRDFGVWGFVVFAVPNIVGAAEMGFVLARPGSSERFVAAHGAMCRVFGIVTIAFQVYFLVWFAGLLGAPMWLVGLGIVGAAWLALRPGVSAREWSNEAAIVWAVSVALAVWFVVRRGGVDWLEEPAGGVSPRDLAALAAVCGLGFVFCPYLDLTFHRAKQATGPGAGKAAFAIGFGVLFAAMIAFTAMYAVELAGPATGTQRSPAAKFVAIPFAAHIVMQLFYTIGVHGTELGGAGGGARRGVRRGINWPLAGALVVAGGLGLGVEHAPGYARLNASEVVYRGFMAFYGLVFPAYVWICCSPIARTAPPTRRMLGVWGGAMVVAGPFYWMGFIEREWWWLLVGVAVVVGARFVRGRRGEDARAGVGL